MEDAILSFSSPTSAFEMRNFVEMIRILVTMNGHPNALPINRVSAGSDGRTSNLHFPLVHATLLEWISREELPGPATSAAAGSAMASSSLVSKSLEDRLHVAHQLVSVMSFSHAKGIAHRYLTSAGILLKGTTLYVAGFETARASASADLNYICPRNYRPPEVILSLGRVSEGPEPLEQVDAWSIGCLLYEIATSKPLFSLVSSKDDSGAIKPVLVKQQLTDIIKVVGTPSEEECKQLGCNARHTAFLKSNQFERKLETLVVENMPTETPAEVSAMWVEAISKCLQFVNTARISMKALLELPLFAHDCPANATAEKLLAQHVPATGEDPNAAMKLFLEELGLGADEELLE